MFFKRARMKGRRDTSFFEKINLCFVCFIAATIQHGLKEWKEGELKLWGCLVVLLSLRTGGWTTCNSRISPVACVAGLLSERQWGTILSASSLLGYAAHISIAHDPVGVRWSDRNDTSPRRIWCRRQRPPLKSFVGVLCGHFRSCCTLGSCQCRRGPPATIGPLWFRPSFFETAPEHSSSRRVDVCTDIVPCRIWMLFYVGRPRGALSSGNPLTYPAARSTSSLPRSRICSLIVA